MKTRIVVSCLVVLAVSLVSASLRGGSGGDRPPFAAESQWIRLSDDAGLYLTHVPDPTKMAIWVDGRPSDEARSELWIRVKGAWVPAHIEPRGGRTVPAI